MPRHVHGYCDTAADLIVVANFWQNFGKMLLVFSCIGTDFFNKIFTKFSNNISKFFITKAQLAFVCNPA